MKRSRLLDRAPISRAEATRNYWVIPEPYAVRALRYDLVFTEKMEVKNVGFLLEAWVVGYQSLEIEYSEYLDFDLSVRAGYMNDLREKLESWFYDKYSNDYTDDLTEEEKEEIEQTWFNWQDIIELILQSDYFDLLYRFIEQIAGSGEEITRIEVLRRKVIINYGKNNRC